MDKFRICLYFIYFDLLMIFIFVILEYWSIDNVNLLLYFNNGNVWVIEILLIYI